MQIFLIVSKVKGKVTPKLVLEVIGLAILLFIGFTSLNWLGIILQGDQIKLLIQESGALGWLVYSLIYLASVIFAPLPGFPATVAAIGIYGVWQTVLLSYILSLVGATTNFFIARHLGRPILHFLVGSHGVKKIERLTENFGIEVLVLTRLFDSFLFEWISYAAGLTNISYKIYMLITLWGSIPYHLIILVFASMIPELGRMFVVLSMINYALLLMPILYYLLKSHFFMSYKKVVKN